MREIPRREFLQMSAAFTAVPYLRALEPILTPPGAEREPQSLYFPETGHHLGGRFLEFYRRNRNGLLLGKPVTEELNFGGRTVQYFENARLEHHPENQGTPYELLLGLLGEELVPKEIRVLDAPPLGAEFYRKHGGVGFFGRIVSHPFREGNKTYQYTQRFLLVQHDEVDVPDWLRGSYELYRANRNKHTRLLWPGEIRVESLGRLVAQKEGYDTSPVQPDPQAVVYNSNVLDGQKRILVSLSEQRLTALEGRLPVLQTSVSTGTPGFNTPVGEFSVFQKTDVMPYISPFPERRNYNLPAVPFNMRIIGAVLIHGAYWHSNFGRPASSGCINLNLDDAAWLYGWARLGTPVIVKN